jgi:hypothetical protein
MSSRPAPLAVLLLVTFLGSVSSGIFWAAIFFVTAGPYHFSPARNLALAAAMGAVYALGARYAGTMLRALERRLSPRAVLGATLAIWGLAALAPLALGSEAALWGAALLGAAASAVTWPIVESYLAAGRHGSQMRAAIGWFNVTWTPATAVPLLVLPLFAPAQVIFSLGLSVVVNAGAVLALLALPARPGAHEPIAALAAVGPEYPWLMRSASWLLPLSYVMSSTLAPVLPHRLAALGHTRDASLIAASWMAARFATLALMGVVDFWHGRWGTLVAAGAALAGGLGLTLLATTLAGMVAGLLLFGVGMGLTYYAALYYALAVGHAAVDAGGTFEALIGVGYCLGPMLGIGGHASGEAHAGATTFALAAGATALATLAALGPYRQARAGRGTKARGRRV